MTVYRTTSKRKRIAFTYSFHFKIHMWRLWIIALQVRFSWNHQVKSNYPIETLIQKKHHTNEKMCDAKIISSDVVLYSRIYCLTLLNASFLHAHKYKNSLSNLNYNKYKISWNLWLKDRQILASFYLKRKQPKLINHFGAYGIQTRPFAVFLAHGVEENCIHFYFHNGEPFLITPDYPRDQ